MSPKNILATAILTVVCILTARAQDEPKFALKPLKTLKLAKAAEPTALAFSPDGKWIATTHEDGSAWLWDIATGKNKQVIKPEVARRFPTAVAFSPDGKELAFTVCGTKIAAIARINVANGKTTSTIEDPTGEDPQDYDIEGVAYQPGEAKYFATAHSLGDVKLWDRATGKLVKSVMPAEETGTDQVEFTPDGKTLISSGSEFVIRLWSVPDLKPIGELKTPGLGKIDSLDGFSLSANGKSVATCGTCYLQVWDIATKKSTFLFQGTEEDGTDYLFGKCALSPDGKIFVAAEYTDLLPFSHADNEDFLDFLAEAHTDGIDALQFSPDGKHFATLDGSGVLKIWKVER